MNRIKINMFEDSYVQFKRNMTNPQKLAEEIVAFSNSEGGQLYIGVDDDGSVNGLSDADINRLNQLISNVANENCKPPVYPLTEILDYDGKKVLLVNVKKGYNKPYCTSSGLYIKKSGSDKRKISPDELRRLFAESGNLFADEEPVQKSTIKDLNSELFYNYLEKTDSKIYEEVTSGILSIETVLHNLDLMTDKKLTLASNLLFGIHPQKFNKSFYIDCVYFEGNDTATGSFITKEQVIGSFSEMFKQTINFLLSNLRYIQVENNFNSQAMLEIPKDVLVEFVANALVHRDYYINSSIKVFIFNDRVEIISPGKLPNSLTVEKIKSGISIHRNPILNSIAKNILPYSGFGSGIRRAYSIFGEHIELINDIEKEIFICIIKRLYK